MSFRKPCHMPFRKLIPPLPSPDRSGMDKSSSATCLLYSGVVNGDPSPTWLRKYQEEDEEEAVKREIEESEIFVS